MHPTSICLASLFPEQSYLSHTSGLHRCGCAYPTRMQNIFFRHSRRELHSHRLAYLHRYTLYHCLVLLPRHCTKNIHITFVYAHIHTCICTSIYIHILPVYVYTVPVSVHTYKQFHIPLYRSAYMYTDSYTDSHTYTHMSTTIICKCVHTQIYIYIIHIQLHILIHIHIQQ